MVKSKSVKTNTKKKSLKPSPKQNKKLKHTPKSKKMVSQTSQMTTSKLPPPPPQQQQQSEPQKTFPSNETPPSQSNHTDHSIPHHPPPQSTKNTKSPSQHLPPPSANHLPPVTFPLPRHHTPAPHKSQRPIFLKTLFTIGFVGERDPEVQVGNGG